MLKVVVQYDIRRVYIHQFSSMIAFLWNKAIMVYKVVVVVVVVCDSVHK